jgi:retron-type reverse transcriptase
MKRLGGLLEKIAEPENLRYASWKAAKGKRYSASVLAYQADLEENIALLRHQIISGQVSVGDYRYFKVFEPKERQICASAFREQVLHHALMNVCHDRFEQVQIFDSYASRKGKGHFAALERAQLFTKRHAWFLKLDVQKFFESIHHSVLKAQLARLFKEKPLLGIFSQIIDSYSASTERGLPIGNLTSQYFANHFLSGLDHFIKETMQIKAYVRYMDDMVLWSDDKAVLQAAFHSIREFVETQLGSTLKPLLLKRSGTGLPFVGFHIFPYQTRLLQKSKVRFIQKLQLIERNYHTGIWNEAACQRHFLPLRAFISHADSAVFRQKAWHTIQGQSS